MSRATNKDELIEAATNNFAKMWQIIETMPAQALAIDFDFSGEPSKKEAHWQRDKNLRDVLIHLHEWHLLLIHWVEANMAGQDAPFLPAPYTWKTYGEMNVELWRQHQTTQLEDAKSKVLESHDAVLALVQSFSNEALFTKKYYKWTGTTSLGTYCVSSMPSHYDWASKKLRAHSKKFSGK